MTKRDVSELLKTVDNVVLAVATCADTTETTDETRPSVVEFCDVSLVELTGVLERVVVWAEAVELPICTMDEVGTKTMVVVDGVTLLELTCTAERVTGDAEVVKLATGAMDEVEKATPVVAFSCMVFVELAGSPETVMNEAGTVELPICTIDEV